MTQQVIKTIDDGHISNFKNKGVDNDICKKCLTPWPCSFIVEARATDAKKRKASRGSDLVR